MQRIVIVGGGLAGYQAAATLLRSGFDGQLTVIGAELHRPYDRPPLSKEMLGGQINAERCMYPCANLDVEWILGRPATGLAVTGKLVRLAGGTFVPFDGLVIATGRRARCLREVPQLAGILTLRTLDDALALQDLARPGARIVIVGAGFIGCEVAATLRQRGIEDVTLVDVAPRPLPTLGSQIGSRLAEIHSAHGVRLRMNASIVGIEGTERVAAVRLADGERIKADVVLVAIGSIPNSEWLTGSGLPLAGAAVRCDDYGAVPGAPNIMVAGDVAALPHRLVNRVVSVEHWSNARETGAAVAANLLLDPSERKALASVPTFWSDQYDSKIKSAGLFSPSDQFSLVDEDPAESSMVVEVHRDGALVGAVGLNANRAILDYQRRFAAVIAPNPDRAPASLG